MSKDINSKVTGKTYDAMCDAIDNVTWYATYDKIFSTDDTTMTATHITTRIATDEFFN